MTIPLITGLAGASGSESVRFFGDHSFTVVGITQTSLYLL